MAGRLNVRRIGMRISTTAWLCLAGLLPAGPAFALTISNLDAQPHTISVSAGAKAEELKVEPQKSVEPGCSGGCKIKLENGEEYEFKGNETVSIDGGAMFIDSSPDAEAKDLPDIDPDAAPAEPSEGEEPLDEEESAE
jgi:hypothetical protein